MRIRSAVPAALVLLSTACDPDERPAAPAASGNLPAPAVSGSADSLRLEVVGPAGTRSFTLAELRAALPVDTARVRHDPAYEGRAKRYVGFPLERLLAHAGVRPTGEQVLYFVARDGYRATMADSATHPRLQGIVAFADVQAEGGWEAVRHGARSISPGPFYLVWGTREAPAPGDTADPALRRPWPYQLARIEVVEPRRKYDRIYPTGVDTASAVYRGFRTFVIESNGGDQCVACHALNRQGGSVGPELNVPRNITEYRDEATLAAFIRNARAFRAGSAMPAFEGRLTDAQIADVLAYLRWMSNHKVAPDSAGR